MQNTMKMPENVFFHLDIVDHTWEESEEYKLDDGWPESEKNVFSNSSDNDSCSKIVCE